MTNPFNALTTIDDRHTLIQAVLDAVQSQHTRRAYERHLNAFLEWHTVQGQPVSIEQSNSSSL